MTRFAAFVAATLFVFAVVWVCTAAAGTLWALPVAVTAVAAGVGLDVWYQHDQRRRAA